MTRLVSPDKGLRGTPPKQLAKFVHGDTTEARGIRAPHNTAQCLQRRQALTILTSDPCRSLMTRRQQSCTFPLHFSSGIHHNKRSTKREMMAPSHPPTRASALRQRSSRLPSRCTSRLLCLPRFQGVPIQLLDSPEPALPLVTSCHIRCMMTHSPRQRATLYILPSGCSPRHTFGAICTFLLFLELVFFPLALLVTASSLFHISRAPCS